MNAHLGLNHVMPLLPVFVLALEPLNFKQLSPYHHYLSPKIQRLGTYFICCHGYIPLLCLQQKMRDMLHDTW